MDHALRDSQALATLDRTDAGRCSELCATPRRVGLPIPEPLFSTKTPASRRSSCTPPLPPGGQPDPTPRAGATSGGRLRCPDDGRLHLLAPAEVATAARGDHAQALCGQRIPAEALTINHGAAEVMCPTCLIRIPAVVPGRGPSTTAP
ncbi:MAG: hypothetical protein ACRDSZ_18465 [Pseudonocardiaceae bacterium]